MDNNKTSGISREVVSYEEELAKIINLDDSIEPEVLRGIDFIAKKKKEPESSSPHKKKRWQTPKNSALSVTIKETLLLIDNNKKERENEREKRREHRHKETMDLIKTLFNNPTE